MLQLSLNLVLFCDYLTTRDYTCGIVVTVGWGEAGRAHSPLSLALVLVLPLQSRCLWPYDGEVRTQHVCKWLQVRPVRSPSI